MELTRSEVEKLLKYVESEESRCISNAMYNYSKLKAADTPDDKDYYTKDYYYETGRAAVYNEMKMKLQKILY